MPESKAKRKPIPKHFASIDEAADFWDKHDLTNYLDATKVVHFDVNVEKRVFLTALEPELAKKLTDIARRQGITTETLINVWLAEKMEEATT
jgi:hypothetical protein